MEKIVAEMGIIVAGFAFWGIVSAVVIHYGAVQARSPVVVPPGM